MIGRADPRSLAVRANVLALGEISLETTHGRFEALVGRNLATGSVALALRRGDVTTSEPLFSRIHSSCVTSETFGGCDCDCVEQLDSALARIAERDRGVVFYLMQEGRGAGFAAKARDRMLVQASENRKTTFEAYAELGLASDDRRYGEVGALCDLLGVCAPLRILTSNPDKVAGLERDLGVALAGSEVLPPSTSPWNRHYISSKSRSGHRLDDPGEAGAGEELPEPVTAVDPRPVDGDGRFVHLATYLLPIRDVLAAERGLASAAGTAGTAGAAGTNGARGGPRWFRLFAYADLVSRIERVVLTVGREDAPTWLVRVQRESLLERFPLVGGGRQKLAWHRAVRALFDHGAGCATFLPSLGFDADMNERVASLEPGVALLAHHLRGRAARIVVTPEEVGPGGPGEKEAIEGVAELLRADGVRVLEPLVLGRLEGRERAGQIDGSP